MNANLGAKNICGWRYAFAQKTSAADATLSCKKHLSLPLGFRARNICWPKASGRNYAEA